jgi:hypothetical protein
VAPPGHRLLCYTNHSIRCGKDNIHRNLNRPIPNPASEVPAHPFKKPKVVFQPSALSLLARRHDGYFPVESRSEAMGATLTGLIIHEAGEIGKTLSLVILVHELLNAPWRTWLRGVGVSPLALPFSSWHHVICSSHLFLLVP